ncbi:MAG: M55 family metallopeptidase [Chloroflexota bacterium]|nr:M55 family metallopeptidase [Chloroflexota bacterium]
MRVYLSVDMEGLAGVAHPAQTYVDATRGGDLADYERSRTLMAGETNAAIEACLDAGATEVVVNDSHWRMRNLRAEELHPAARLIIGAKPMSMCQGIERGFDAAAFIGYHAGAGHPTGVIGHTYSSEAVMAVRVNDVPYNEAGINALVLAKYGVPVVMVSGDDALAEEIEQLLPWAERVIVKRALGERLTESLSPSRAHEAIRDGLAGALARLSEMPPYRLPERLHLEVDLRLPVMADYAALMQGVERIGPRTVGIDGADPEVAYGTFLSVTRLAWFAVQ